MDTKDVILALVGFVQLVCGFLIRGFVRRTEKLEDKLHGAIEELPEKYVMKEDFKDEIAEVKKDFRHSLGQVQNQLVLMNDKMDKVLEKLGSKADRK